MKFVEYEVACVGELIGKTLSNVENNGSEIIFTTDNGIKYALFHDQDCCETVFVEDVAGDLSDLVGSPIIMAEDISGENDPGPLDSYDESYTWTFYKFATVKGYVTIRFYGTSNGYYSESVDFKRYV